MFNWKVIVNTCQFIYFEFDSDYKFTFISLKKQMKDEYNGSNI